MKRNILIIMLALLFVCSLAATTQGTARAVDHSEYGVDLAYGRRVVSTEASGGNNNVYAVDNNPDTRYASRYQDDVFWYVDLGSTEWVKRVVITWETAYAAEYEILLSCDAAHWTTVATITNTEQTQDVIEFPTYVKAKFVKFQGIKRATKYGYSFYSFEVYGAPSLALSGQIVETSSDQNESGHNRAFALDNDASTSWQSETESGDNQCFIVDLLSPVSFDTVKMRWGLSFARRYRIYSHEKTSDGAPSRNQNGWTELYSTDASLGEVDSIYVAPATARYLKVELVQRETNETSKKKGLLPWETNFEVYSFELFDSQQISSVPLGQIAEFSVNSPAWCTITNISLNPSGLILAPIGYPIYAKDTVTDLESIADGYIPGFESYATYNPAVIYDDERQMFHMIYRAELPDNFSSYFGNKEELGHMSSLAYAYSYDGINYVRGDGPIAWADTSDEKGGGLEDPRVCRIKNDPNRGGKTTYYITYTMYDNRVTREGIIYTHDFITFHKQGRLAPEYGGSIKSGSYVCDPEGNAVKIADPRPGKSGMVYVIYMKDGGYARIGFTTDALRVEKDDIVDVKSSGFGSNSIEELTSGNESCMAVTNLYGDDDEDIYLMYGGGKLSNSNIQHQQPNASGWFYALGALKATKSNPFELTNVRLDLDEPTMYPTDTNKIDYGLFNKCMFADTMVRYKNTWYFYYGAGDMYVGLATANGDFSAGAAAFEVNGNVLTAKTKALNKKYGQDKSDYDIQFVAEVYDIEGNNLDYVAKDYSVKHFLHSAEGIYYCGEDIDIEVNLNGLPKEGYYVLTYVIDKQSGERLNNVSVYTNLKTTVTSESYHR